MEYVVSSRPQNGAIDSGLYVVEEKACHVTVPWYTLLDIFLSIPRYTLPGPRAGSMLTAFCRW